MGVGPNYVLTKGFLAQTPVTAYAKGLLVIQGTVEQSVITLSAGTTLVPFGVVADDIDATKIATGKAYISIDLLGISRVKCGAVVTKGDRITNDASSRGVTQARTAGASQPQPVFGIALTTTTAVNQFFDMLLTPGACF
jgi:hypothetical protein